MSQAGGIGGGGSVSFPITPTQGGTGLTSYVTGDMLYASATNTLSALPIGQVGAYLGSTGTLPEWETISNSWYVKDEFLNDVLGSELGWGQINGGSASINFSPGTATAAHPGVRSLITNGAFASSSMNLGPQYTCGGGRTIIQWIAKLNTLSSATDRYDVQLGLGDTTNDTASTNGVFFFYQDNVNSGNWRAVCVSGGVATNLNSTIAADTNFHHFTIDINAAGTSVSFAIDGVSLGAAITTNIPTTTLMNFQVRNVNQGASTGASMALTVDAFMAYQKLTTAR